MTDYSELKKLAVEVNSAFPDKEDMWSMVCTPTVALDLIADIERLTDSLSKPDDITAEPAGDYDALRKQFMALRSLANSNSRMVSHWRNQCGIETRETMLANAGNVSAERDTNQVLTDALLAAEDERDQLKAENEALRRGIDPKWSTMDQTFVIEFMRSRSVFDADNIDRMMQFAVESAQYVELNPSKDPGQ